MSITEADLKALSTDVGGVPEGVRWVKSYCDFDDNKFFCEWEGPSKDALEQTFEAIRFPYDVIYPVKIFDVTTREIEA